MDKEALIQIEEWLENKIAILKSEPLSEISTISYMGFNKLYPVRTPALSNKSATELNGSKIKTFELILNYIRTQKDFANEN